jgi:hypothetical protein
MFPERHFKHGLLARGKTYGNRLPPDFLSRAPDTTACAAFIEEDRIKPAEATNLDSKSGSTVQSHSSLQPDPTATGRRADIVCLSDVQPRPVEWLWQDRLAPGTLSMLSGDGIGPCRSRNKISKPVRRQHDHPARGGVMRNFERLDETKDLAAFSLLV